MKEEGDDQANADANSSANNSTLHPPASLTPGSALLIASLPLGIGGYIGYRRALHPSSSSSLTTSNGAFGGGKDSIIGQMIHPEPPSSSNAAARSIPHSANKAVSNTPPAVLAARALVLGSILSITATSLMVSGIFYASGCSSWNELITTWRIWAPRKLHEWEQSLGNTIGVKVGDERRSAKAEYEQAIQGMNEEEEIEFVMNKCSREIKWDEEENASSK